MVYRVNLKDSSFPSPFYATSKHTQDEIIQKVCELYPNQKLSILFKQNDSWVVGYQNYRVLKYKGASGLSKRKYHKIPDEIRKEIKQFKNIWSLREIGTHFGVSHGAVYKIFLNK